MEIQILNLYLCCKVKQFICTCKLFCKNPANYQLCIRFHLNFIKRWRRVWRMLSTGKLLFGIARIPFRRYGLPLYGVGHRLPDAALAARRRCGACFGPRARMVGVSHLLGGGRNAERLRFFRDEALRLIAAGACSAAGVRNRPVPVLHRAAPRPQAVRPPAPRLVRSGIYPSLVRRSPPERSFSLRTSRRGAAHGFKISTNGLEIQIVLCGSRFRRGFCSGRHSRAGLSCEFSRRRIFAPRFVFRRITFRRISPR